METPIIIGITGGSGSGKTTFIRAMRDKFSKAELSILSQDDYYFPKEKQTVDDQGVINFDLPESIDGAAFAEDIRRLKAGETVKRQEYTFNNEKAEASTVVCQSAPVILVEGLFVFHFSEIRRQMDIKIYVHADDVRKLKRRILRDRTERNYPLEDVLYRYEAHVLPAYRKYIEPYKETADIIINNNDHFGYGLELLEAYIARKVQLQRSHSE